MAEEFKPGYSFTDNRLNELMQLFPEAFEDGRFNVDALRDLIGDYSSDSKIREHFGLNWVGKRDARRMAAKPPTGTLKPRIGEGVNEDSTENIFIEGENLEVLKILRKSYAGRIKMIYIDPPYNTTNDLIYKDDFTDSTEEYLKKTGDTLEEGLLVSNPKTSGKFHGNWLSFIYPRVRLAKDLLKDDGVIFISIDQNEVENLKQVCDEIFGSENYIANISVINNYKGRSDDNYIATGHEYLLIYKKDSFETSGIPMPDEYKEDYKLVEHGRNYRQIGLRKRGDSSKREDRPKMFYPIYYNEEKNTLSLEPDDHEIEILPKLSNGDDGRWRWGIETTRKNIHQLEAKYVSKRKEYDVVQKDFICDENGVFKTVKPKSFWMGPEFSTEAGGLEFKRLFGYKAFENPKPVDLIINLLYQSIQDDDDIVLDFFAGSGTTGQATLKFSLHNKFSPKFILVQLPDEVDKNHPAFKKGHKTISSITKERIRLSMKDLNIDDGFTVFEQSRSTMYKWQDFDPKKGEGNAAFKTQMELAFKNPIQDSTSVDDFVTEILLNEGFPLTASKEDVGNGIYKISHEWVPYTLFVTMTDSLSMDSITDLKIDEQDHFVCLDKAFQQDNSLKQTLDNKCKLFTI